MIPKNLPLKTPKPDIAEFNAILTGQKKNCRVPLVEYAFNDNLIKQFITVMLGRQWVEESVNHDAYWDNFIAFWYHLGYDYVRYEMCLPFPENTLNRTESSDGREVQQTWTNQHQGQITSWDDFEKYEWPRVSDFDFSTLEYIAAHLPEGMGFISCHAGGFYEHLSSIMSYEGLGISLFENPELVQAVVDKLGNSMLEFASHLTDLPNFAAIWQGDDMGFRTSTLISPKDLRRYILPWHKKQAELAHQKNIPYYLHSCGNIEAIMDDLIDDVKIDAKHSFEDAIIPVAEFQKKYGDRIGVMGGLDLNILTTESPEGVREKTRQTVTVCRVKGSYGLGSGNSIPFYIPAENYLAMVDELHTQNK